jgi:hypothetical protein
MRARNMLLVTLSLILLGSARTLAMAADEEKNADSAAMKRQLHELLSKRVQTAMTSLDSMQAAYEAETATLDQLVMTMNNLVEAKLAIARTPQEEIAALEEHLTRAKQMEHKIELLYQAGSRGGEANQYSFIKFTRESAEISLLKARLKVAQ